MIFGGYSRPVVADRELKTVCDVAPRDADRCIGARGSGKLDRIADEVHEDLLQRHAFRLDGRELVGHLYPQSSMTSRTSAPVSTGSAVAPTGSMRTSATETPLFRPASPLGRDPISCQGLIRLL